MVKKQKEKSRFQLCGVYFYNNEKYLQYYDVDTCNIYAIKTDYDTKKICDLYHISMDEYNSDTILDTEINDAIKSKSKVKLMNISDTIKNLHKQVYYSMPLFQLRHEHITDFTYNYCIMVNYLKNNNLYRSYKGHFVDGFSTTILSKKTYLKKLLIADLKKLKNLKPDNIDNETLKKCIKSLLLQYQQQYLK